MHKSTPGVLQARLHYTGKSSAITNRDHIDNFIKKEISIGQAISIQNVHRTLPGCKAESCTLELRQSIQMICTEIYKILNHMGLIYMNNLIISSHSNYSTRRPLNLFVPRVNQTMYGLPSFRYQRALRWNSLPEEIKTAPNLNTFKNLIKNWSSPACKCNFCTNHHEEMY